MEAGSQSGLTANIGFTIASPNPVLLTRLAWKFVTPHPPPPPPFPGQRNKERQKLGVYFAVVSRCKTRLLILLCSIFLQKGQKRGNRVVPNRARGTMPPSKIRKEPTRQLRKVVQGCLFTNSPYNVFDYCLLAASHITHKAWVSFWLALNPPNSTTQQSKPRSKGSLSDANKGRANRTSRQSIQGT